MGAVVTAKRGVRIVILAGLLVSCARPSGWSIEPSGRITEPDLKESSGLVASRRHRNVFWTHNDDGEPEIFAINRRGRILARYRLESARNIDWEEIAIDEASNLYVLDNTSRIFSSESSTIYSFPEPNPNGFGGTIAPTRVLEVPFHDGGLDVEAMFCWKDWLYLINKPWDARLPRLFRISLKEPSTNPEEMGTLPIQALVTGADIDRTGKRIAVSSYRAVFVFEGEGSPADIVRNDPLISPLNARQVEAITWEGNDLVLSNEQRDIFYLRQSQWSQMQAPFYQGPREEIPRLDRAPDASVRLEGWEDGLWLRAQGPNTLGSIGRVAWSEQGLHIGVRLPSGLDLLDLSPEVQDGFLDWFRAGRVYVLLNPSGNRSLTYEPEDRCVVVGRSAKGELVAQARQLRPGTLVQTSEENPGWIELSESRNQRLVTLTPDTPGMGRLEADDKIGFNLLIMAQEGRILSWTPLTLRFSWDNPSVWGLLETRP